MSSEPDGTDDRILQPEGQTVLMASTTRQSKARKYHQRGCKSLSRVKGEPKEIDIAVARWKGMEKCSHCWNVTPEDNRPPSITAEEVDRARKALVWGNVGCPTVASAHDVSSSTLRYHVAERRDYDYPGELKTPKIEHDPDHQTWVWDG